MLKGILSVNSLTANTLYKTSNSLWNDLGVTLVVKMSLP